MKRVVPTVAIAALALSACAGDDNGTDDNPAAEDGEGNTDSEETDGGAPAGDDLAGALDCRAVDVIVPYSPGGGSDQQVRRVQQALEATLDTRLNVTYQTGGDGSVGWNALKGADADGCTIANVVAPNIMNLSETAGDEVGFQAEDFEYIAWTEYSPNIIAVASDSDMHTFDDFVAAAEDRQLTMSGVGVNGQLLVNEVIAATGIDIAFVPVSGGVGDIIPQVAGGHIDAAISGFSLLDGGQLRPIVMSAESAAYDDIQTFVEAGYDDVQLVTSWGFILPPETPRDIVETWNAAVQAALTDPDVQAAYEETGFTVLEQDVDEARAYFETQLEATRRAIEATD